jgi:hypothetical protein
LKGWSRNIEVARNKRKKEILTEFDLLDSLMEQPPYQPNKKLNDKS